MVNDTREKAWRGLLTTKNSWPFQNCHGQQLAIQRRHLWYAAGPWPLVEEVPIVEAVHWPIQLAEVAVLVYETTAVMDKDKRCLVGAFEIWSSYYSRFSLRSNPW